MPENLAGGKPTPCPLFPSTPSREVWQKKLEKHKAISDLPPSDGVRQYNASGVVYFRLHIPMRRTTISRFASRTRRLRRAKPPP